MYAQICFFLFLMFISFKNNGDNTNIKKVDESNLKVFQKTVVKLIQLRLVFPTY